MSEVKFQKGNKTVTLYPSDRSFAMQKEMYEKQGFKAVGDTVVSEKKLTKKEQAALEKAEAAVKEAQEAVDAAEGDEAKAEAEEALKAAQETLDALNA